MMAGIRGKDTKPEMLLRRGLHAMGFRYRLHDRTLPGRPDMVFPGRRAVVLINGCFWHGHDCHLFKWPKSRDAFWRAKIQGNIVRDVRTREQLIAAGWRVLDVWECTLKGRERLVLDDVLEACRTFLVSDKTTMSVGSPSRQSV